MIRFLFRFIGLLTLALGFIFVIYDGVRSISGGTILLTKTSDIWDIAHERSLQAFQALTERYAGAEVWQFGVAPILDQPAAALAGVVSVILILLGRKKRRLIGYARD